MKIAKRGQAALEFLMTYGWAFLVIMIMIGALAYFGVLSPQQFLPDRCKFGSPILCDDTQYQIRSDTTDTIRAQFTNNFGQNVRVKNFTVSTDYSGVCEDMSNIDITLNGTDITGTNNRQWDAGENHEFSVDCNNNGGDLAEGDKVKFQIEGEWWPTDSAESYAKPVEGEIYATVQ